MKLTRITSEFKYGDWIIHRFGIDEDGESVHLESSFRDYFYFDADQIGNLSRFNKIDIPEKEPHQSIYGKDTLKVEYTSIKERKNIEEAFPEYIYESDVKPEFKFLNVAKDITWADAKDRHILYFDIETWTDKPQFSGPDNPFAPITSIQGYSSKFKQYFMFTWHEQHAEHVTTPEVVEKENCTYIFCKDEADVILSFFSFLRDYGVDVITGWYSSGFDLPYILNRCSRLNLDPEQISPLWEEGGENRRLVSHYQKVGEWKTYIKGLDHIDMMDSIAEMGYNLSNNKLATAAKEILENPDIEKITEVTWKHWHENFSGFMKYGLRDVEILKEIDETLGIFDLYCTVQKFTNITSLDELGFKSSVVDKYIMTECHGKFVFPTRITAERVAYMGATVLDPKPGLYDGVGVVDYASLYPTSIMSFNLSPETFICSETQAIELGMSIDQVIKELDSRGIQYVDTGHNEELFGKRYLFHAHTSKIGLLPKILKKMYAERRRIKAEMKTVSDPIKKNALDKHQYALKIILNSAYGAFGFNYFRLYKPEVADSITFFARRALEFAINDLEKHGNPVIYGDTDSCFFSQEGKSNDEINKLVDKFNTELLPNVFIPTYNFGIDDKFKMMEIEYEKDLEKIYFGVSKKRYYGIERNTGKKYIRGLNIIRRDAPTLLKDKLNAICEKIVRKEFTINDLKVLWNEINGAPYSEIGITKAFGKQFSSYVKMKPQHLKGALFANSILDCDITHKDTPFLFYVVSHCQEELKARERHKAICILPEDLHYIDEKKDLFELDYKTFYTKQVLDQLKEFNHIPYIVDILDEYKIWLKNK